MRMPARVTAGVALMLAAAGCATTTPEPTLYRKLGMGVIGGGREKIAMIVNDFVANAAADDRIAGRFKGLNPAAVERLKSNLADQLCEATGGPCSYVGRDMKTAHRGMNITETEWTATVEALSRALDKNQVAPPDRAAILTLLGPMKKDIVGQ